MRSVIRTLIVDDENIARRVLRDELSHMPEIEIVGEAEDGGDALRQIAELAPDLVFLDLQMPGMSGFEVIRHLNGPTLPVVVIVTAYNQHAIQAFDAGATDYLLKPVRSDRLAKAVERAKKLMGKPKEIANDLAKIGGQPEVLTALKPVHKLVGRLGREYFLLDPEEVLAIQAESELVWIITADRRLLAGQTLRAIEPRLPGPFFQRIHRNTIVNVNHVRKITALSSKRWLMTLGNGLELVASKRQAQHVRRILHW